MKKVESYHCSYCNKLYEKKSSCKSHEYRCYYNPKTRSCATCAYIDSVLFDFKPGNFNAYFACLLNNDITSIKLTTKCDSYKNNKDYNSHALSIHAKINIFEKKEYLKKIRLQFDEVETNSNH